MGFHFLLVAAGTAVHGHQLTLLDVKLFRLVHHPFVMAITAQGIALVLFLQGRLAKGYYLSHCELGNLLKQGPLQSGIP